MLKICLGKTHHYIGLKILLWYSENNKYIVKNKIILLT